MTAGATSPSRTRCAPTASGSTFSDDASRHAASAGMAALVPPGPRHIATVAPSSRSVPHGLMSGTPTAAVIPDRLQRAATMTVRTNARRKTIATSRSEEHTSELQSLAYLVCRLLLEKKKKKKHTTTARQE